jgi:hypothetical protein
MSRIALRFLFVAILVIASAAALGHRQAYAAGPWYVATTGSDANDCLSPATPCATIDSALDRSSSGDTINVAEGTYFGSGDQVISPGQSAILSGGWNATFTSKTGMSTIDGQGVRRGVLVFDPAVIVMDSFIIRNGTLFNSAGGILNQGTLTLTNSVVSDNVADFGAGISNSGMLTLDHATVSGNTAATFGGGILNHGTLTVNNSTISGNTSVEFGGGGIANSGGTLILNNSTVSGNSTSSDGGGLLNAGGPTGTITLNNSTVSGNSAIESGGGIANFSTTGAVTLNYSTVTNNISDSNGDQSGDGGGIVVFNSNGILILQSTIVAGNRWGTGGVSVFSADCLSNAAIVSQGYNLTGDGTGCDPLGGTGDVTVDPATVFTNVLSALANHGGATQTHALIPGPANSALDAIPSGTNDCGSAPFDIDQRGVARPQGAGCDRGAFEWQDTGGGEEVDIDILPGSTQNVINLRSRGTVPVAILSTADFDARAMVDRTSLTFGATGNEASLSSCNSKGADVNHDGRLDLVCHFHIQLTGFQAHHVLGILKGSTVSATPIEASDVVRIVKK